MGLSSLLQYLGEQSALSGVQEWAKNHADEIGPLAVDLAQSDPRIFRQMLPNLMGKQAEQKQEAKAARDFFGIGQPDASGITWNNPDASALARLQGLGQEDPIPQTLPDSLKPILNYDPQSRFDLTPEQTALLAIQNAQKAQGQAAQAKKVTALGALAPALQQAAAQSLSMGDMGATGGTIDKIAEGIANYKIPPLNGFVLKTPQGLAIQSRIMDINPDYDANKFTALKKSEQDMQVTGSMGKTIASSETAINHLAAYLKASEGLGGVNLGFASNPINAVLNLFKNQSPDYQTARRLQSMAGDEVAKFVAGASGGTEEDRRIQRELLSLNNSPDARKAAAQAAVKTMFGKLEPIANQYNQLHGTDKPITDFLSPETKKSLAELDMLPEGEQPAEKKTSALAQISAGKITPEMARAELARRRKGR